MQPPSQQWFLEMVAVLLFFGACDHVLAGTKIAPDQNQCVICHTNVKGLIRLSWEVERLRPKKAQSTETSGEG